MQGLLGERVRELAAAEAALEEQRAAAGEQLQLMQVGRGACLMRGRLRRRINDSACQTPEYKTDEYLDKAHPYQLSEKRLLIRRWVSGL